MPVHRVVKPKGLPFPELPSGPLMDHEQALLDAMVRAVDKKIRRPPNNFMLFRSWAIRCHKDPHTKIEHLPDEVAAEFRARGAGFASEAWKQLSADGKAHWTIRSRVTANAHALLFPDYQYRPVHQPKEVKDAKKQKQREERIRKGLEPEPPKPPRKARKAKALTPCDSQLGTPASSSTSLDEPPIASLPYPLTPASCAGSFTPGPLLSTRAPWVFEDRLVTRVADDWNHFEPPQPTYRRGSLPYRRGSSVPLEYPMRQDTSQGSLDLNDMPNIARTFQPSSSLLEQNFQFPVTLPILPVQLPRLPCAASAFEECVGAQAQAEAAMASSSTIKFIDPFNPSSEISAVQAYNAPLTPFAPDAVPCALDDSFPVPEDAQFMGPAFGMTGFEQRSSLGFVGLDQPSQYPMGGFEQYSGDLGTTVYAPAFDDNTALEMLGNLETADIDRYLSDTQPSSASSSPYTLHSGSLGLELDLLSSPSAQLLPEEFGYNGPF
ncbi:hypothetical protein AURDEDRAFT_180200 [Auricularia subglabra TFB-10046 SS5]|nr:hypothetical protein AURDEDRAFT_180200 [Auricularia subglabra TFB-10046 SS5]